MYKTSLKEIRNNKHLTQDELAEISGVGQSYISEIENALHNPTVTILILLCLALDVSPSELLDWSNIKKSDLNMLKKHLNLNDI